MFFGLEIAMFNVISSIAEAQSEAKVLADIQAMPEEVRGRFLDAHLEAKEKRRLERREEEMHAQLCRSIEKAGDNARPRPWEFY